MYDLLIPASDLTAIKALGCIEPNASQATFSGAVEYASDRVQEYLGRERLWLRPGEQAIDYVRRDGTCLARHWPVQKVHTPGVTVQEPSQMRLCGVRCGMRVQYWAGWLCAPQNETVEPMPGTDPEVVFGSVNAAMKLPALVVRVTRNIAIAQVIRETLIDFGTGSLVDLEGCKQQLISEIPEGGQIFNDADFETRELEKLHGLRRVSF